MKLKNCDECNGKLVEKQVDMDIAGNYLGKFAASVCSKCGQTLFDMKTSREMERIAKEKGLFGIGLKNSAKLSP